MKVLVVASHPQNGTGYGRVTNKITNYLASIGVEVFIYAIRKYDLIEKRVDPSIKIFNTEKTSGYDYDYDYINILLDSIKPDSLFIYDEIPVILNFVNSIKEHLKPPNLYLYLDIVFPYMKDIYVKELKSAKPTQIFTFLDCWKEHLINDLKFDEAIVSTLPHGVDGDEFLIKESVVESKKRLGFNPDDFIVLNMNRNSYRKCLDTTIQSFLAFLKEENLNPKIKLYLHCEVNRRETFNILDVISMECLKLGVDFDNIMKKHIIFSNKTMDLTEDDVHRIYNACDVGMNTCCGEGFGLTTVEHSCFNKPQIVSAVPALKETMNGIGYYASIEHSRMFLIESSNMLGYAMYPKVSDFTKHLKYLYHNQNHDTNYKDVITSRYDWNKTYTHLNTFFGERSLKTLPLIKKDNMKILFVSTHPLQGTGYSRVANKLTNYLANIPGIEVVYYALQNFATIEGRSIDPKIKIYDAQKMDSKTLFSYDGFVPVLEKEKPDALFIYYETALAINYMDMIPPHLKPKYTYLYLDIVYRWQKHLLYTDLKRLNPTHIFTFLNVWKKHLVDDIGFDEHKVTVLPHGIDFDNFFKIPAEEAKLKLGFKHDDFIILNMNRNSFRKMLDRTVRPFLEFLKHENFNSRIKLLFGCEAYKKDSTNNLVDIIILECFNQNIDPDVILKNHILFLSDSSNRSEEKMNLIYNACDVGINTSGGEGFGLTLAEHGYLDKTIITSKTPSSFEVLGGYAYYIDVSAVITAPESECNLGHVVITDEVSTRKLLIEHFESLGYFSGLRGHLIENFSWENAYKVLDQFFRKEE